MTALTPTPVTNDRLHALAKQLIEESPFYVAWTSGRLGLTKQATVAKLLGEADDLAGAAGLALQGTLRIHQPYFRGMRTDGSYERAFCDVCTDRDGSHVPWPCRTLKAWETLADLILPVEGSDG